ncbi:MAG: hypothetical protein ACM32J_14700 [Rhizobacter sp.]
MSELHHSLESMGVLQYLFAVVFLICYALAIGDFLGAGARPAVAAFGFVSAAGFSFATDPWVHGVLLTAFAVIGIGLFLGLAWLLKTLFASAVGEVSVEAAYDDAVSVSAAVDEELAALEQDPVRPAAIEPRPAADVRGDAAIGRLLGADARSLDQRTS